MEYVAVSYRKGQTLVQLFPKLCQCHQFDNKTESLQKAGIWLPQTKEKTHESSISLDGESQGKTWRDKLSGVEVEGGGLALIG